MDDVILDTTLVRSRYLEVLPLDTGNSLCLHALVQTRLVLKPEVVALIEAFDRPRRALDVVNEYCARHGRTRGQVVQTLRGLVESRLLFPGTREEEERKSIALVSQLFGRDPETARTAALQWSNQWLPRFAAPVPRSLDSFAPLPRRLDVVMVGMCDVQIEMDVLRGLAREAGIDLRPIPTFETTLDLLRHTPHDAVIVGALTARHAHWAGGDARGDFDPHRYLDSARTVIERIRGLSGAPVLLHNLPVPTCLPLGFADRGPGSLRARCREINRELAEIAFEQPDVFVVDVEAALSFEGKRRLLDDRVVSFSHSGGLGWWTMLPPLELATVHGLKPPVERLAELGVSDPFEYDRVVAAEQVAMLCACFGVGRRRAVIVDPDGLLWPGALAETGSPFPPGTDFGIWSYHGFYLGIHEALASLRRRGVRFACCGRGDDALVRRLWRYPDPLPLDYLARAEDFECLRIDWRDGATRVSEIADQLALPADQLVFASVNAVERERAAQALPGILLLGENLFAVRGELLTHPALQVVSLRDEQREKKEAILDLVQREKARRAVVDPQAFLRSLDITCEAARGAAGDDLERVHDLVARTNLFSTTARRYTRPQLSRMAHDGGARLYTLRVRDRFSDYGLAGACVAEGNTIELVLFSCRVIGLGVDSLFLRLVVADLLGEHEIVRGRLLELERNGPARGFFQANGFSAAGDGLWEIRREEALALPPPPAHAAVTLRGIALPEWLRENG